MGFGDGNCHSGTPVDCVSLALSGALFSWTKPLMVSIYMLLSIKLLIVFVLSIS